MTMLATIVEQESAKRAEARRKLVRLAHQGVEAGKLTDKQLAVARDLMPAAAVDVAEFERWCVAIRKRGEMLAQRKQLQEQIEAGKAAERKAAERGEEIRRQIEQIQIEYAKLLAPVNAATAASSRLAFLEHHLAELEGTHAELFTDGEPEPFHAVVWLAAYHGVVERDLPPRPNPAHTPNEGTRVVRIEYVLRNVPSATGPENFFNGLLVQCPGQSDAEFFAVLLAMEKVYAKFPERLPRNFATLRLRAAKQMAEAPELAKVVEGTNIFASMD